MRTKSTKKNKINVITLGCSKNVYDSEVLMGQLVANKMEVEHESEKEDANIVVINTCGFINNAKEEVRDFCQVANAISLPFDDQSIDVSISITTLHNLDEKDLVKALLEIERVSKIGSFITLDAYRDMAEKERMNAWNLTAKTVMHVDKWKEFFKDVGYTGDYYWFFP